VAISPEATERLAKLGFKINVESGAGASADFSDAMFQKAGASSVSNSEALQSDLVLKVRAPTSAEVQGMKDEAGLISYI
jgi:NAD/NADP transhydrogenase alpha subunit